VIRQTFVIFGQTFEAFGAKFVRSRCPFDDFGFASLVATFRQSHQVGWRQLALGTKSRHVTLRRGLFKGTVWSPCAPTPLSFLAAAHTPHTGVALCPVVHVHLAVLEVNAVGHAKVGRHI